MWESMNCRLPEQGLGESRGLQLLIMRLSVMKRGGVYSSVSKLLSADSGSTTAEIPFGMTNLLVSSEEVLLISLCSQSMAISQSGGLQGI